MFADAATEQQHNLRHLSPVLSENSQDTIWVLSLLVVASCLLLIAAFFVAYRHVSKYHHQVPETPVALTIKSSSVTRGCFAPLIENQQEDPTTNMNINNNKISNIKEAGAHERLPSRTIERVHVIILVHGWLGCPQDLAYIHHAMEREAAAITSENDENTTESAENSKAQQQYEPFVIHTCAANNNRTNDGIQAGADRISVEIQGVLDKVLEEYHGDTTTLKEITFSMLGFSLGGLYARVALPQIIPPAQYRRSDTKDRMPLPKFTPTLFCTMATPHLGSFRHTYLPIPAFVIRPLSSLVPTGRDLFQHTRLLQQSVTDPQWTEPLLRFEKRIAYTNTFSVDMMVPTTTAAFLSKDGGADHHVVQVGSHQEHPHMALVVETKAQHEIFLQRSEDDDENSDDMDDDNDIDMAHRLDAMGWTKVFVDYTKSFSSPNQTKSTYRSAELISAFHGRRRRQFFHLPNGHDLMPVNSKNAFLSYANRKGRPLVDQMAADFIHDVVHGPSSSLS